MACSPADLTDIQLEQQITHWKQQQKLSSQLLAMALKERKRRNKEKRGEK